MLFSHKLFSLHPSQKMGRRREWFSAVLSKAFVCDSIRKQRKRRQQRCLDEQLMEAEHAQEHDHSVAVVTTKVVPLRAVSCCSDSNVQEIAAVQIQAAFRGYLARRALAALRGLARLKLLTKRRGTRRQAATTLEWMQTVARVQYEVRSNRIKNSTLHKHGQHQTLSAPYKPRDFTNTNEWDNNSQSKEQVETNRIKKQEAAVRRERAMAYAHSLRNKNTPNNTTEACTDPNNPRWGWNWLERWLAGQAWEDNNNSNNSNKPRPTNNSATASNKIGIGNSTAPIVKRARVQPSPSTSKPKSGAKIRPLGTLDEDTRSMSSVQSRRSRRRSGDHGGSVVGSSVRDDESCASSSAVSRVPSYMDSTESARAKARTTPSLSAKKRLSFSDSPGKVSSNRGSMFM